MRERGKRALTFAEDDSALNSLVIVKFKKPDRSDYRKEDPVDQVYRLIREIKSGHFKDKNGREIKVQSELIPAYAYVICDTTREVEIIARNKGLLPTPDQLGYCGYNPNLFGLHRDHFLYEAPPRRQEAEPDSFRQAAPAHRELTLPVAWRFVDMLCACLSDIL